MRVCDRHRERHSVTVLKDMQTLSELDLCKACQEDFLRWTGHRKSFKQAKTEEEPRKKIFGLI